MNRYRPAGALDDNVEVRRWGTPPKFDFAPKTSPLDLGPELLGILDFGGRPRLPGRSGSRCLLGLWERNLSGR